MIAAMGHDPGLAAAIAFGLGAGVNQVEFLNQLDFDVIGEVGRHHIGRIGRARELLAAPGGEAVFAEKGGEFPFASRPFLFAVQEREVMIEFTFSMIRMLNQYHFQ